MSLTGPDGSISASGDTGTIAVSTQPECEWSASAEASWLSVTPTEGQGSAQVQFQAASNPNGVAREGAINVNGKRATVRQNAAACAITAAASNTQFPATGGSATIAVTAPSGCPWTASSNVSWITAAPASGSGTANATLTIAANTGAARTGAVTVGGETITIAQAGPSAPAPAPTPPAPTPCAYAINPTSQSIGAGGGAGTTIAVTSGTGCGWTAASNAPWLTVTSGASGSGNGTVSFTIAANTGTARMGTLTVAGRTFTVNQAAVAAPACSYSINPTSITVGDREVTGLTVAVTTQNGCAWTTQENVGWLDITSGNSGTGNGTVTYRTSNYNGSQRTGTLTIAGQTFTVTQVDCSAQLSPQTQAVSALGGVFSVSVTTPLGCEWQAVESLSWVSITGGSSGTGNGTVTYLVSPNVAGARSGNISIGGATLTVNQAAVLP